MKKGVLTMINNSNIIALRLKRQHLIDQISEQEYNQLYKDSSPVQSVYWSGFGEPPVLSFRTTFDDKEYNRKRQFNRSLVKGRFQGSNLGWIEQEDLELFAGLARSSIKSHTPLQQEILDLIKLNGPMNIQQIKEITGQLVKKITPALHKLQKAFLIYEDQYNGKWDRAWGLFNEMFPEVNINKFTQLDSLKVVIKRFAYRNVIFNAAMVKSFYRAKVRNIQDAIRLLVEDKELVEYEDMFLLKSDAKLLSSHTFDLKQSVFIMHRNDFLVKSNEYWLKEKYQHELYDILQYIFIDGEFGGAVLGKFKSGPYIIEDVKVDNYYISRKDEIIEAIYTVNDRAKSPIKRFLGSCDGF